MRFTGVLLLAVCFVVQTANAQKKGKKPLKDTTTTSKVDSTMEEDVKNAISGDIPVVTLDDNDLGDGSSQNISSVLTAGRDPFYSAAAFNFSPARFRIRGYDADHFSTFMNGVPMENLDNGFTPFGLWGGLNDVMRNKDFSLALRPNTFAFGELGSAINIDSRASKQRKQTEFGYAYSNRNYTHRWSFTHSTGISKKGWAFTFSGSRRWADEGYTPGTYYNGWSYFLGVDKRIGQKHLLSLVAFAASTENGKQGAATAEAQSLAGSPYYNPYWGYQVGKKRNANVGRVNQPMFILTHDYRINNKTSLVSAVSYSFGDRGASSLDWYNAPDPRPDYYRNLPSYYQSNPTEFQMMTNAWKNNESTRQINWAGLYDANRNNIETFNGTTGKRSRYLLSENVTNSQRLNFSTVLNTTVKNLAFTAGLSYQSMKNNYFKRILDMLGGDYFADLNQFAERSYPNNPTANQNDLNRPNRIVHAGDRYGYDYDININKASGWGQVVARYSNIDFFAALELSNTQFWRTGNVKSGLFPNNSYGKSTVYNFNNYAFKGGFTFKIDGRNYFYVNQSIMSRAPFFSNVYVSARTRDITQPNIKSEQIQSVEGGYVLNAPKLKIRLSGYYTEIKNQMDVLSYYDDHYQNLVNYALSNISKLHYGMEFGFEAKVLPNVTVNGAAALGRYYYNGRQYAITTLDNNASVLSADSVYATNYRIGGTPQEAYSLGITYRSPKYWFVSLTGNYFDQMWIDFNPIRRTAKAVIDVPANSQDRSDILNQQQFNGQYTLDFFGGYSWKLPKRYNINHKSTFLVLSFGVSNMLNNQNIITGGFEQLRFDFTTHNVNKFPSKYYYAYGINYFASATIRF
ncbi:MAG: TonB-dependent receptor [Bacteroidetes bacterium]|nr:TonB-dependent receptor [Bacteroidota bacterium]